MTGCKDCTTKLRVDDVWKLYNPTLTSGTMQSSDSSCSKKGKGLQGISCGRPYGKCKVKCSMRPNCVDSFKSYWHKNCDINLIKTYEDQPWFRNRIVQEEWKYFVDQLVTPCNIGCQACPGPDDWQFKCHKARALIGPTVPCVWDLPEQKPCDTTRYGIDRDWRRYNEDQREEAGDITCGCNGAPVCRPKKKKCEWPPYLGNKFGPRYMAWAHPSKMMFPRTQVFNYQSLPKC